MILETTTRRSWVLIALLLLPALAAAETLVIDGGTVHPVNGDPFVGRVVVENGLIAAAVDRHSCRHDSAAPPGFRRPKDDAHHQIEECENH